MEFREGLFANETQYSSCHADVEFINVNLVEATNTFSHF